VERKLSEMSVQTVPAAQKETTAASINVAGALAAVAAAPATYPSSRTSTGSSYSKAPKRQRQEEDSGHRTRHPQNVGAAGAPRGSATFDSPDSPDSHTVRKIRPPRDSLPVRGMAPVQRQQTEHFIRFAVPFVHEKQGTGRLVQMDLVRAYAAANGGIDSKEEVMERVNIFFRNSYTTMRSIQDAASNGNRLQHIIPS
jgi:hypothetical protein